MNRKTLKERAIATSSKIVTGRRSPAGDGGERIPPPGSTGPPRLLEREEELRTGIALLDAARAGEGGGILVVEGPPGVGKTAFLEALRAGASASEALILRATGGELEGGFPFGVVRQLFDPVVRRGMRSLEGPVRHAAAVLGLLEDDSAPATTAQETLHGLYWLVAELTEERPVLLAVDDAHWADEASIDFLEYLARRIEDLSLDMVIATRPEEPGHDLDPIRRITRLPHATHIGLRELSRDAVARLVRQHLGPEAEAGFCHACHEATGGNPFLVLALLEELADEGIEPTEELTPQIARISPETVLRTLLVRLAALPESAGRLAEALSVLGGSAALRHAASLAELEPSAAAEAEEALLRADIIRSQEGSTAFRHPLVREVIYSDLSPGQRALRHAQAAALLHEHGVPAEEIVPHLLASDPTGEEWRVNVLRAAARVARNRGAAAGAVSALRRVLVESPDASRNGEVLAELGSAEMAIVDPVAVERLERAIEHTEDPNRRGELSRKLARALNDNDFVGDLPAQLRVLEPALAERDALRPDLALRIEADYLSITRRLPQTRRKALARLAELRHVELPDDPAAAPLLANLAFHALESTEPADVVAELAHRALADASTFFRDSGWVFLHAANTLTWIDRMQAARAAWDSAVEEARRLGSLQLYGFALGFRAHLLTRMGELKEAEADLRTAMAVWAEIPSEVSANMSGPLMTDIALDRGGLDEAEALLAQAPIESPRLAPSSRSRLHYARGRFAEARDEALAVGESFQWYGGREAPGIIPWRSEAALAMAALGQRDEAIRLATEELALARKQEVPRAIGMALRALGLIEDLRVDRLEEAVQVLEGSDSKIELARALVDLGAAVRRAGRWTDARKPLRRGMDLAHRCGAAILQERARDELLATGARPRRKAVTGVESLTPAELRVARLAAEGSTNREIAQALFVSNSTVATHLNHVYQKLQIAGRGQLADVL